MFPRTPNNTFEREMKEIQWAVKKSFLEIYGKHFSLSAVVQNDAKIREWKNVYTPGEEGHSRPYVALKGTCGQIGCDF